MSLARLSFNRSSAQLVRAFSSTRTTPSAWSPGPSPQRLPKEEQEIFEQLQRQSGGAFSTPRAPPKINQSPDSAADAQAASSSTTNAQGEQTVRAQVDRGEELHPNVRRGAPPEFEGSVNPKTGESNGPKTEPLRWGGEADWSYNGRVTDF